MTVRRARATAVALCALAALLVWNGVFGLLVSRGEKQYLLDQARAELGRGPAASLPARMEVTIRDGVRQATRWALVVFGLSAAALWVVTRARDEARDEPDDAGAGLLVD